MAQLRKLNSLLLFKCTVLPLSFLCLIFRDPVFQWFALGSLIVWFILVNAQSVCRKTVQPAENAAGADTPAEEQDPPDAEKLLLRQINWRITEHLNGTFPEVCWTWESRPGLSGLRKGGLWRIRLCNAEPYDCADIALTGSGEMSVTMNRSVPLSKDASQDAGSVPGKESPLTSYSVKDWYLTGGEDSIVTLIDDLNTQGHKKLLIHEDGTVVIGNKGRSRTVETIKAFPPRNCWDEFCRLLLEDEIKTAVREDGLLMSW